MTSTADAATQLGLDVRQVREYIANRTLGAAPVIGGAWEVDLLTVRALSRSRGRGRRWKAETAWAALELLALGVTDRLGPSERSRLRARLCELSVERLAYLAEGRGTVFRFRQHNGRPEDLRARVAISGASALQESEPLRRALALASGPADVLTAYIADDLADDLVDDFVLKEDIFGEVLLRVSPAPAVNAATIALDLYCYGATRESSAGRSWLEERIHAL